MSKQVDFSTVEADGRRFGRMIDPDTQMMPMQSYLHEHVESIVRDALLAGAPSPRAYGLNLTLTSGRSFSVAAGQVINQATGKSHTVETATVKTLAAAHSTLPRIDLVYALLETDAEAGEEFAPWVKLLTDAERAAGLPRFTPEQMSRPTELHTRATIMVKQGTPAGSPAAPAAGANEVALYRITVPAAATNLVSGNVTDVRPTMPSLYQVANNVGGVLDEVIEHKVAALLLSPSSPLTINWDDVADTLTFALADATPGNRGVMTAAYATKLEGIAAGAIAGVAVRKNGAAVVGTEPGLNFIEGAGVTLTVADNAAQNRVDITVTQAANSTVTNITPAGGADFTLTQNGVNVLTSVNAGALVNTLYLSAGKVGFGVTDPLARIDVIAGANAAGLSASQIRLRSNRFHLGAAGSVNAIGGISFMSNDSTNPAPASAESARISCIAANVHSDTDWSAHVVIHTTNVTTISEVARFTSDNRLGLNVTNPTGYLHVAYPSGAAGASGVTNGLVRLATGTYTDSATLASGTAAAWAHVTIGTPTLAAANTLVTTTDAASLYITAAPIAGTNQTITNAWSLWVDAGNERHDGSLQIGGTAAPADKVDVTGNVRVSGHYKVGTVQVVGARDTGWAAWTGTASKATKATGTATTLDCAQAIKAIIDALMTHGLFGA